MKFAKLFRASLVFSLALAGFWAGCYRSDSLRLQFRSPSTAQSCVEVLDRVFFDAGYMRLRGSSNATVYTLKGPALSQAILPLRWGIGVWMPEADRRPPEGGTCEYELQAVSEDPNCGVQCPLTPQPGTDYDQATRDMAARLRAAFAPPSFVRE